MGQLTFFFRHRAECAISMACDRCLMIRNDYIVNVNYVYREHMTNGSNDNNNNNKPTIRSVKINETDLVANKIIECLQPRRAFM